MITNFTSFPVSTSGSRNLFQFESAQQIGISPVICQALCYLMGMMLQKSKYLCDIYWRSDAVNTFIVLQLTQRIEYQSATWQSDTMRILLEDFSLPKSYKIPLSFHSYLTNSSLAEKSELLHLKETQDLSLAACSWYLHPFSLIS